MLKPNGNGIARAALACICALALCSCAGARRGALMDSRGMLKIGGEPRFVLGMYENPAEDARLKEAVDAGFNLFQAAPDAKALDRLQSFGARAWINLGGDLDLSAEAEARSAALAKLVTAHKDHPALLLWEGPDEALWISWYDRELYFAREEFKAMSALTRGAAEADRAEIETLRARTLGFYERALWPEFEGARAEFWKRAGAAPPRPKVRMDSALEDSIARGEGTGAGLRLVRGLDPGRALWLNHAPRNSLRALAHFNREADAAGCDIYPAPGNAFNGHSDLGNVWPSAAGDYTRRMRAAAPGKSCVMVLQGFGWNALAKREDRSKDPRVGRPPTRQETRFMAWSAILNGANAVLYWGTAMKPADETPEEAEGRAKVWKDLMEVGREIRELEPAILARPPWREPRVALEESFGSVDGGGVTAHLRKAGDEYFLFVLNENQHGAAFELSGLPRALEGREFRRAGREDAIGVKRGRMRDGIRAMDVQIYRTSASSNTN